jgi:hypothetical protein
MLRGNSYFAEIKRALNAAHGFSRRTLKLRFSVYGARRATSSTSEDLHEGLHVASLLVKMAIYD